MAKTYTRRGRGGALVLVALLTLVAATTGPAAEAGTLGPGPVTRLTVDAVTGQAAAYRVSASWRAGRRTKFFEVRAKDALGNLLDRARVDTPSWVADVDAAAGTTVRVVVRPSDGVRRGTATRVTTVLPDLTPPTGSFRLDHAGPDATLSQSDLADDVTPAADITRVVDWGDGAPAEAWGPEGPAGHTYPAQGLFHPTVTLTDAAGNGAVVPLGVLVLGDRTPPDGDFSSGPTAGWASYTTVRLTQRDLHDDFSAAADIRRTIVWGDGETSRWRDTAPAQHVYQRAGAFTPHVMLVDEAGNRAIVDTTRVVVDRDAESPEVTLDLPRTALRSAATWRTVEGRGTDVGTGLGLVRVKAAQKRGAQWYAYLPASGKWVPAGSTLREAWHRGRATSVFPARSGRWLAPLSHLTTGVLVYLVTARDQVGNRSPAVWHRQRLTRP